MQAVIPLTILLIITSIYWWQSLTFKGKEMLFPRDSFVASVYSLPNYTGVWVPLKIGWNKVNMPAGSIKFHAKKWFSIEENRMFKIRIEVLDKVRRCGHDTGQLSSADYIFDDVADLKAGGFKWLTNVHIYLEPDHNGQMGPYIRQLQDAYQLNSLLPYGNPKSFIQK